MINLDKDKQIIDAMLASSGARVLGVNPEEAIYWTNFDPEYLKQYITQLEQAQSRVAELSEELKLFLSECSDEPSMSTKRPKSEAWERAAQVLINLNQEQQEQA